MKSTVNSLYHKKYPHIAILILFSQPYYTLEGDYTSGQKEARVEKCKNGLKPPCHILFGFWSK